MKLLNQTKHLVQHNRLLTLGIAITVLPLVSLLTLAAAIDFGIASITYGPGTGWGTVMGSLYGVTILGGTFSAMRATKEIVNRKRIDEAIHLKY